MTPHRIVNPDSLAPPSGYAHAVVAAPGRCVYLGGQIAAGADGVCRGETLVEQFGRALDNVVTALEAAGAAPTDVVSLQIFVTDVGEYRRSSRALGEEHRSRFGRHYPAVALLGVTELFDPAALVELVAIAVVAEETP
jgi:enamine deaminase RidA (YjgF/YER057c/UK114 family)